MPKLVMLPPIAEGRQAWVQPLQAALPQLQIVVAEDAAAARREIVDADAVYGWVPPDLLPLAQKLRWLQSPTIGPHIGFYYKELIDHPLVVTNPRGIFNDHIGQHIMMFVLTLARGLPYYMAAQRERRWDPDARKTPYIDLSKATALVAGIGNIGHEAARLCHAFGMRVIGVDPRWEYELPYVEKRMSTELDSVLPEADFVIVAMPHTPETEGLWNRQRFGLMKSSAYFINIGRGMTTKLDDLVAALENGEIAGCALDVFEIEPLPAEHRLWTMPNVLLTPHIAAKDAENLEERQYQILLDNAQRFVAGEPLRNVVNKGLWY